MTPKTRALVDAFMGIGYTVEHVLSDGYGNGQDIILQAADRYAFTGDCQYQIVCERRLNANETEVTTYEKKERGNRRLAKDFERFMPFLHYTKEKGQHLARNEDETGRIHYMGCKTSTCATAGTDRFYDRECHAIVTIWSVAGHGREATVYPLPAFKGDADREGVWAALDETEKNRIRAIRWGR